MWGVAALVALVVAGAAAQRQPSITFISGAGSGEVVQDLGKSVELVCQVKDGKEYPINWIKVSGDSKEGEAVLPLSTGKTLAIRDPRFNVTNEVQDNSLSTTLRITDIQRVDAATYKCQVPVDFSNKITKEVRLRVKTPVEILPESTARLEVGAGEEARLECLVSGFPTPTITWARVDRKVFHTGAATMDGPTMLVTSAHSTDRGKYRCTAKNSVGPEQTHEAELVVRFGPTIAVRRPRVQQAAGYDVILQCQMEAFPGPKINWFQLGNEQALDNSGQYSVAHFTQGPTTTTSSLRIAGVTKENYGKFECQAENSHGEASSSVELSETNIPIPEAAFAGVAGTSGLASVILSSLLIILTLL